MLPRLLFFGALIALSVNTLPVAAAGNSASVADARCQQVTASGAVTFHGRTLEETPDIRAPALRQANSLLSHRCRTEAIRMLDAYTRAHPGDYQTAFLKARLAWTAGGTSEADQLLADVLRDHPDFYSAAVLQASRLIVP